MGRYVSAILLAAVLGVGCSSPAARVKHADKAHKKPVKGLLEDAREDAKSGDYDAADAKYAQLYDEARSFNVLEERIDMLIHGGRATKAVEVSKVYYEANVSDVKGVGLYTEALIAAGEGSLATGAADEMIAFNAEDASAHDKKGRALLLMDKDDEAIVELRRAVNLDKASAAFHESLGQALIKAGKVDEAALEFRAAIKTGSNDAEAHVLLGAALRAQGELEEAKRELDRAIELDGRSGKAYFELGLLLNAQTRQPEAEVALSKAVQLSPNESRFWYAYGEIFRLSQRDDEALSAYKKAVDLDPPYGKAMTKYGTMLIKRKRLDEAKVVLTNAVRREPKNAANYLPLGVLYATLREPGPAIDNYERFLKYASKTDPDRERVKQAISQLKH